MEDGKVREIEEYPQLESNWQKRITKGQEWYRSIAVPLGKVVDKPAKFYKLSVLHERKANEKHSDPQSVLQK